MEATTAAPERTRPSRADVDPAALRLIARHGSQVLAIARRWSLTPDDAEDAYQRGLEILLTKAPTTSDEELVPWLKTVVKHEAFAIRRQRERATPTMDDPHELAERAGGDAGAHEQAERLERLRHGAEALGRLKPQEVRALLLRAEGYSYRQIQEITGWSYTKVNRCVTEGRASFLRRLGEIEAGSECERLASKLSALADGEAGSEDMAALRPHLRSCLACRARLREYRAAPKRLAALLPIPLIAPGGGQGRLARWIDALQAAASERTAAVGLKTQQAVELASAQKVAAVAASTAVLAGGGVATVGTLEQPTPARLPAVPAADRHEEPLRARTRTAVAAPQAQPRTPDREAPAGAEPKRRAAPGPEPSPAPAAAEFEPAGTPAAPAASTPAPRREAAPPQVDPASAEFEP